MVLNAYDVKVCVWKTTKTCLNVSKKHPYVTSCVFLLSILYICWPLCFWILIYSLPPVVSTWVTLSIRNGRRCKEEERDDEREKEREQKERESGVKKEEKGRERMKKAYSRVHSVRRRKAKELERGEDPYAKRNTDEEDEDEDEYLWVNNKAAAVEETPKEITIIGQAVEVAADISIYRNPEVVRSLKLLKDEGDGRDEAGKAMEVNIAEAERNKRLESLMARRRSKKVLKKPQPQSSTAMPPILIPKVATWCSPSFSPGPGSAPSMLGPTRNPFDLPYDPHEEKPDLTGDAFLHDFAPGHNRDFTFCRHESFSLGPSLPIDFFDNISSLDDLGIRPRRSSIGYQFPRPDSDTDFGATTEAESDSKSSDHRDNDEVHAEAKTRPNALDELSLSEGSTGSSEDDRPPVCKINREAILKSLSMRRNSVSVPDIEMESNDQLQENNLSYANSALENASRLKQQYFADKPQKRHGMTFSIASDMQVEVSELSSPPLTIGENMSYQDDADGEMQRNASWDGLDSWAGSSRLSEAEDSDSRAPPPRPRKFDDASRPDEDKRSAASSAPTAAALRGKTIVQTSSPGSTSPESTSDEEDQSPAEDADAVAAAKASTSASASSAVATISNDPPQERLHHPTTISPKSVLQPTLSVASFEHEDHDLPRAHNPNAPPSGVDFTLGTTSNAPTQHAPSTPPNASTNVSLNDQHNTQSSSSTSLSSNEESDAPDYGKIQMSDDAQLKQESSSSRNVISYADKGKMVIQESTHDEDTETSSGDYDSEELEERDRDGEAQIK